MPNDRRNRVAGARYFFTVTPRDRRSDVPIVETEALRGAVRATRARDPFPIDAWVVPPDHLHCPWTPRPDDVDCPARWSIIKAMFSRSVPRTQERRASLVRKRESGLWQRRPWEHTIRDEWDFAAPMDTNHFNPVKHGCGPCRRLAAFELCHGRGAWPPCAGLGHAGR